MFFNSKLRDICFNSKLRYVLKLYGNFTGAYSRRSASNHCKIVTRLYILFHLQLKNIISPLFLFLFPGVSHPNPVAIYETEPSTGDFSAMQRCVEEALTEAGGFQGYDFGCPYIIYPIEIFIYVWYRHLHESIIFVVFM